MKIADWFLTSKNAYTSSPPLKMQNIAKVAGGLGILSILALLFYTGDATHETKPEPFAEADFVTKPALVREPLSNPALATEPPMQTPSDVKPTPQNRTYSSSQLVTPNGSATIRLPIGSTFQATLLNRVVSSDAASPVIATIAQPVHFKNVQVIDQASRLIGTAALDSRTRRLQIRFTTLVTPDGQQSPISALALQSDGSSGLAGDFDSGNLRQQVGRFGGNFVAGLADGLKERQPGGWAGPLEPGSLKNGLLNGLADSAADQANRYSNELQTVQPTLTVESGTTFYVYLEQEFAR